MFKLLYVSGERLMENKIKEIRENALLKIEHAQDL